MLDFWKTTWFLIAGFGVMNGCIERTRFTHAHGAGANHRPRGQRKSAAWVCGGDRAVGYCICFRGITHSIARTLRSATVRLHRVNSPWANRTRPCLREYRKLAKYALRRAHFPFEVQGLYSSLALAKGSPERQWNVNLRISGADALRCPQRKNLSTRSQTANMAIDIQS